MNLFPFKWPKVRRICAVCGREFIGRPDAVTCSNACRQAAYRARKAEREQQRGRKSRDANTCNYPRASH